MRKLIAVLTYVGCGACLLGWIWTGAWQWAPTAVVTLLLGALIVDALDA